MKSSFFSVALVGLLLPYGILPHVGGGASSDLVLAQLGSGNNNGNGNVGNNNGNRNSGNNNGNGNIGSGNGNGNSGNDNGNGNTGNGNGNGNATSGNGNGTVGNGNGNGEGTVVRYDYRYRYRPIGGNGSPAADGAHHRGPLDLSLHLKRPSGVFRVLQLFTGGSDPSR